ncbi:MAG: DNA-binding GntR family transcriptional regulator [Dinoroseobacter sp.]|jgi:DNA-binding GntR family transcriptional regulator
MKTESMRHMQTQAIPKYERAYRSILKRLKDGRYPVGGRVATEAELSEQFGVSRVTIRRALDMLVQDGYVESRQGSGYRVVTLSPASDTCLTSFTDAMLRAGLEPRSRFISLDYFAVGATEMAGLPPELLGGEITRVVRLRLVDEVPTMLVETYAPSALLSGARAEDFPETGPDQSILRILGGRFALEWSAACEDISPVLADTEMAQMFEIAEGQPLLKQACSAFNDAGDMVFHEEVFRKGSVSFNLAQSTRTPRHV